MIEITFTDLRDLSGRIDLMLTRHGSEFIAAVCKGALDCLLCGAPLSAPPGERTAMIHAYFVGKNSAGKSVLVNVGCCQRCLEEHGSVADTGWAMSDFIRTKVLAPVAA
jgi:hypothetical protein